MSSVLITGANRGLGLELARQYAAAGWRVFACCRTPDQAADLRQLAAASPAQVSIHALDLQHHAQMESLAQHLRTEPIDLLLNNAGISGPRKMFLGRIDYPAWAEVFAVNTMAPLKMTECFLEHVARSERKTIACITSMMGSMACNREGRHYLYRSSKAALNAVVKSLSLDLRERHIIAVVLHPGWVRTDMGGADADLTPQQSVHDIRQVLARLQLADSGKFFNHDGTEIPW